MENKMLCCDCPYGYEDYMKVSEVFDDLSQEEICRAIWCDKIGGKVDIWDTVMNILEWEMLLKLNQIKREEINVRGI